MTQQLKTLQQFVILSKLQSLMTKSYFDLTDVWGIMKMLNVNPHDAIDPMTHTVLQGMHCVAYNTMTPEIKQALVEILIALFKEHLSEETTAQQVLVVDAINAKQLTR